MVGGNVETSQRVVDVLLGALGAAAASQGTMNNLTFGDGTFGYYETICGGSGATPESAGADAVHTHMTNTRLTDPEVIERRYPVRVHEFSIRRGSGGAGQHCGGDGILRKIEFLKPLRVSILSERRGPYAPFGLAGGAPGSLGENSLHRTDGSPPVNLGGKVSLDVKTGDLLTIQTPGGGGWGQSQTNERNHGALIRSASVVFNSGMDLRRDPDLGGGTVTPYGNCCDTTLPRDNPAFQRFTHCCVEVACIWLPNNGVHHFYVHAIRQFFWVIQFPCLQRDYRSSFSIVVSGRRFPCRGKKSKLSPVEGDTNTCLPHGQFSDFRKLATLLFGFQEPLWTDYYLSTLRSRFSGDGTLVRVDTFPANLSSQANLSKTGSA